jgi:hypothetical protein
MIVSNQLNVGGIAEITGATKLNSTLDVNGATKLNSTLDVTGATIKNLLDRITALEAKTSGISADGQSISIKGPATVAGIRITNNGTQFGLGYHNQNDIFC